MREKHLLLSDYIHALCEHESVCNPRIGNWSTVYFDSDDGMESLLTDHTDAKTTMQNIGLRVGDIIFAIVDNPRSIEGAYFGAHKMYISSKSNIDQINIYYRDIQSINMQDYNNICVIMMTDGSIYRISSDLWNNGIISKFLKYALTL